MWAWCGTGTGGSGARVVEAKKRAVRGCARGHTTGGPPPRTAPLGELQARNIGRVDRGAVGGPEGGGPAASQGHHVVRVLDHLDLAPPEFGLETASSRASWVKAPTRRTASRTARWTNIVGFSW